MTKTQIRVIFTDNLESLWDIYLMNNLYPYRIKVWDLIWEDEKNQWRVSQEMNEMNEQDILNAPIHFKKILQGIIAQSNE